SCTRATSAAATTAAAATTSPRSAKDVDIVALVGDGRRETRERAGRGEKRRAILRRDGGGLLELRPAGRDVPPGRIEAASERDDGRALARVGGPARVGEEGAEVEGPGALRREHPPIAEQALARQVDRVVGVIGQRPERSVRLTHDDRAPEGRLAC